METKYNQYSVEIEMEQQRLITISLKQKTKKKDCEPIAILNTRNIGEAALFIELLKSGTTYYFDDQTKVLRVE